MEIMLYAYGFQAVNVLIPDTLRGTLRVDKKLKLDDILWNVTHEQCWCCHFVKSVISSTFDEFLFLILQSQPNSWKKSILQHTFK